MPLLNKVYAMSPFHPTKRDMLIILTVTMAFALLVQLDLVPGTSAAQSVYDAGLRRPTTRPHKQTSKQKWLDDVEAGVKASGGEKIVGVSESKFVWGDEGAPRTEVLAHAPGWTIFDQIYLYNGTWYLIVDNPSTIPLLRMITSTGNEIWNDQESIAGREPTDKDMKIIFPSEAQRLWGNTASRVYGTSFLINDPPQFLDHYYHFAAEMLVGMWRTYSSLDPTISATGNTHLPSPSRMLFPHTPAGKWNDYAKMNSFLSRAIFPSMSYEYENDFLDRTDTGRAFAFDRVVFADRAAAFRGKEFQRTWRTASEAVTLGASRYWWAPVRKNLLEFVGSGSGDMIYNEPIIGVGVEEENPEDLDLEALEEVENAMAEEKEEMLRKLAKAKQAHSGKPVITYISRQDWGRRMLIKEDHDRLVQELEELQKKYGWEVNVVSMDKLSRDEQIRLAARTTIMLGVHGNGLTHLLWMNSQNPRSTVIEIFFPGGFAMDYEFTARALGIRHYGVWKDTVFTAPDTPQIDYPEGFQGSEIPVDGKVVADLIVQRLLVERIDRIDHKVPAPMADEED